MELCNKDTLLGINKMGDGGFRWCNGRIEVNQGNVVTVSGTADK